MERQVSNCNKQYALLVVWGDVEPEELAWCDDYDAVLELARKNRKEEGDRNGLFPVWIDWENHEIEVGTFSGGELAFEEDKEKP